MVCRHYHLHEMDGEAGLCTQEELLEAEADEQKRGELRESMAMQGMRLLDNVSKISIATTSLRLLLLWAPPVLYMQIFLPCWECYDFEAAAVHEIGHSLGLMHPDQAAPYGNNLAWKTQVTTSEDGSGVAGWRAAKCDSPWADVEQLTFSVAAPASVMTSFTQFNKEVCLQQDDLDALNTLYPVCDHRVLSPQCFKTESYIGLVRLSVFVGLPVTLMMWLNVACHALVVRWERWRREELRAQHDELICDLERELVKVQRHGHQLKRQQSVLRQQHVKHAWVGAFKITAARGNSERSSGTAISSSARVAPSDTLPANSSATPQNRPKPSASTRRAQRGRNKNDLSIWSGRVPELRVQNSGITLSRRSPIAAAVAAVYGTVACAESEAVRPPVLGDQVLSPPLSSVSPAALNELRATTFSAPAVAEFDDLACTAELGEQQPNG